MIIIHNAKKYIERAIQFKRNTKWPFSKIGFLTIILITNSDFNFGNSYPLTVKKVKGKNVKCRDGVNHNCPPLPLTKNFIFIPFIIFFG